MTNQVQDIREKRFVLHKGKSKPIALNPKREKGGVFYSPNEVKQELIITPFFAERLALITKRSTRFVLLEGPARGSKTALAIQAVYYAMLRGSDITRGLIASKDNDTLMNNLLKADVVGFLTTHPECRLETAEIGGYYIRFPSTQGEKQILITGYDNEARWTKVLGGSLDIVLIDEANIANPKFVRETFARQIASNSPLTIFTTNGDNPDNMIYEEFGNYARPLGAMPASTLALINEFQAKHINDEGCVQDTGYKPGYYYLFFQMKDNPIMTADKLKNAKGIFPKGSYYYITKILGERAQQGEMIFVDYLDEKKILVDKIPFRPNRFMIGFDIGATKAYSVLTLTAWSEGFKQACVIKIDTFKTLGYEAKKVHLRNFILSIDKSMWPRIEWISIDSAEANFIADIETQIRREFGLHVTPSYKATIKDRIDVMIIGFSSGRLTILKECSKVYDAYMSAKWEDGKIGQVREDLGLEINDIMDSTEYSITPRMATFKQGG